MSAHASLPPLSDRYRRILDTCEPFVISYTDNWPYLDFEPLGVPVAEARRYTATSLRSRRIIDGLHRLDRVSFGDQDMLMPRWVLFDCGEFPGLVFGLGRRAASLPREAREVYAVADASSDDVFVPLSMWVAIRCVAPDAWFGHNLSSANLVLGDDRLPGLGTLTKLLGVAAARARVQYGATQWASKSLGIHLTVGLPTLASAWTPAHTHPATLSYRLEVDAGRLRAALGPDFEREAAPEHADLVIDSDDEPAMRRLQDEIEGGAVYRLVAAERGEPGRLYLLRCQRA